MSIILNLILFVFILGVIVCVHEFGHFILAKMNGVYVYEFSIGMGPRLWGFKKGETDYNIRLIPIGGFCALAGEDLDDDDAKNIPKNNRLQAKKAWQRFLIMLFGPMNNFILAVLLLFVIALCYGGTSMKPIITSVELGSAAYKAGLDDGDRVIKINNHKVSSVDDISLYLAIANPKGKNTFYVEKTNGKYETIKVKPEHIKTKDGESYKYGIGMQQERTHGFLNAIKYSYQKTCSIFKQMFVTVGSLFTGGVKVSQLSGPVGIYSIVGEQSKGGLANILYLIAFLSINVGFINLLPIPAFDGGHILFIIIEKIKGSPVNPELENKIHAVFLMLLLLLMIVVTFNDILRLF